MYTPTAFKVGDLSALDALIARDAFVALASPAEDGSPGIDHRPVLCTRQDQDLLLEGRWARPNPQARHAGRALAIVHGPQPR